MHPGGPFFTKKDEGVWSIPKGEFGEEEDGLDAAIREFKEETRYVIQGQFVELKPVRQKSGKIVTAWAINFEIDETKINSNTFQLQWPPGSGTLKEFPEIDKAGWFDELKAKRKIIPAQTAFIDELIVLNAG